MISADLVGTIAGILIVVCYIPQVWHTIRTRDVSGVSLGMYVTLTIGVGLWVVYAIMLELWPLMIANMLSESMIVAMLIMKIAFTKKTAPDMVSEDAS